MRTATSEYTSQCDRCGEARTSSTGYPPLVPIYLKDNRGELSSSDPHRNFMDLCPKCFQDLLLFLNATERWEEWEKEKARYNDLKRL